MQVVRPAPTVHTTTSDSTELGDSALLNRALTSTPPRADRADGIYVYDAEGREYVDFGAGIAVTNIGQNVEEVKAKIKHQLDTASFIYNGHFSNTPAEEAASLLLGMCPEGGSMAAGRVLFCNSGSEGNEIALKLCLLRAQLGELHRAAVPAKRIYRVDVVGNHAIGARREADVVEIFRVGGVRPATRHESRHPNVL